MRDGTELEVTNRGAFVRRLELPPTAGGPLDGLTFAVKDLIDVGGVTTGAGNPTWLDTHPPATVDAVCVEQLRAAGATCVGKTVTDELAFSLVGENAFYGTPLNPRAPDRVPGGSSSGSASAVAQGIVDFALGTDTGGSVRVPASNCGLWGIRPSYGAVSVGGVNPFAPGLDTVGLLADGAQTLVAAASVLLGVTEPAHGPADTVHLVTDAFALADEEVRAALSPWVERVRAEWTTRETALEEIGGARGSGTAFESWLETFSVVQWAEIESTLGAWIAAAEPAFGGATAESFRLVHDLDRGRVAPAAGLRERYARALDDFLGPADLLCIPTAPAPAPVKGTIPPRSETGPGDWYPRALSLTSIAGIGRLPQVSLPAGDVDGVPVGLSLLARRGRDDLLLGAAGRLAS
jgi:amidase